MNIEISINKTLDFFFPIVKKWLPYEVYAYLAVGAVNTGLNIALFSIFYKIAFTNSIYQIFNFHFESYSLALIIAFTLTVPTGFWLSKKFAFKQAAKERASKQLGKYFFVVLQGVITDYLLFKALIIFINLDPVTAKVLSTTIVLSLNYLLQKFYTFKIKKSLI